MAKDSTEFIFHSRSHQILTGCHYRFALSDGSIDEWAIAVCNRREKVTVIEASDVWPLKQIKTEKARKMRSQHTMNKPNTDRRIIIHPSFHLLEISSSYQPGHILVRLLRKEADAGFIDSPRKSQKVRYIFFWSCGIYSMNILVSSPQNSRQGNKSMLLSSLQVH